MGAAQPVSDPVVRYASSAGVQVRNVRGSLIASSLETLRELGYFDRYIKHLPGEHRDAVLFCLATSWVPVELAMVHYGACEAMALGDGELAQIGEFVAKRIMGTFLGTMLRSGRAVGATPTPWIALRQYARIWERLLQGGSSAVFESGQKDAVTENSGIPMLRYRYFRAAMVGMTRGGCGLFARSCLSKELAWPGDSERIRISVRWV